MQLTSSFVAEYTELGKNILIRVRLFRNVALPETNVIK